VRRRLDQPVVREQMLDDIKRGQLVAAHVPRQIVHRPVESRVRFGRPDLLLARGGAHLGE
jgi:hypothetical protein